jgi:hypothetical protein
MTDRDNDINGICLRGKAGWGEGGAFITVTGNSFGARWFDEDWNAQFDQPEWAEALNFFVDLMNEYGPPGYATNGFNENLSLFQQGKCGMWIDATVAASFVTNPADSTVADNVGFALAPDTGLGKRANWLWAWALAIPAGTQKEDAAKQFIEWATSKDYIELVAENEGWANVPPGARTSLYENPEYQEVPVRADDARFHQRGRSEQSDGRAGALCRHPVRRDPGVCRHRDRSQPGVLGCLCRSADRRGGAGKGPGAHQRRDGSRRLPLSASRPEGGARPPSGSPPRFRSSFPGGPVPPTPEEMCHGDPAFPIRSPLDDGAGRHPASWLDAGPADDDAVFLVQEIPADARRFAGRGPRLGRVRQLRPLRPSSSFWPACRRR